MGWGKSIKKILDYSGIDDKMETYINDVKINLFDYHDYDNFAMFKTEIGKVFGFLKHKNDGEGLLEYIMDNEENYCNVEKIESVDKIID